jgi:Mg-chelatase subunit ChlD
VKASGATALYASILKGIELLKDKERPTLVVFTDGVNESGNPATKEQVMDAAKSSNIPLFTIGFGPKHDNKVLLELASISDGKYYPAKDQKALDNVFAAINSKIGNLYQATYERPKKAVQSDVPVVSIVIDCSRSMDDDPSEEGCAYRMQKLKNLFHDFIVDLPEPSLIQLMGFSDMVEIRQIMTSRKPAILDALGELQGIRGTEILSSAKAAYDTIKPVPSTKKIIVYVTDAALKVDDESMGEFEDILRSIKEENIQALWVGMGVEGEKEAFAWAAEKSGGKYVISEDPKVLKDTFSEIIAGIKQMPPSDKTVINMDINMKDDSGEMRNFAASRMVSLPQPQSSGKEGN